MHINICKANFSIIYASESVFNGNQTNPNGVASSMIYSLSYRNAIGRLKYQI